MTTISSECMLAKLALENIWKKDNYLNRWMLYLQCTNEG